MISLTASFISSSEEKLVLLHTTCQLLALILNEVSFISYLASFCQFFFTDSIPLSLELAEVYHSDLTNALSSFLNVK